jgi:hypothetical protein
MNFGARRNLLNFVRLGRPTLADPPEIARKAKES